MNILDNNLSRTVKEDVAAMAAGQALRVVEGGIWRDTMMAFNFAISTPIVRLRTEVKDQAEGFQG